MYGYPRCSTCRKASAFLRRRGVEFDEVDITTTPPKRSELSAMLAVYGGVIRKLFNTSGQAYRALGLSDKLPDMPQSTALGLLAGNGKLVKRPFLVVDGKPAAIGFDEDFWSRALAD
jgi:arsenate reductase